jgi:hypothetical protein
VTLRLTVQRDAWLAALRTAAVRFDDIVPVIKGNGYGFGAPVLMQHAILLADTVAVGTVFESRTVPTSHAPMILTPVGNDMAALTVHPRSILTVGSTQHVATLRRLGFGGRVVIKLRSSMNRYGIGEHDIDTMCRAVRDAGLEHAGWSLHPPLPVNGKDHAPEASSWLSRLNDSLPLYVSHLHADSLDALRTNHPKRRIIARSGTELWLGDKSPVRLSSDVLEVRRDGADIAGYRPHPVPHGASIVMVGAGSSHGVTELAGGLSPFHFANQRMALLEAPHMHTSMLVVDPTAPCPNYGDTVDVQQPMTRVTPDAIDWV